MIYKGGPIFNLSQLTLVPGQWAGQYGALEGGWRDSSKVFCSCFSLNHPFLRFGEDTSISGINNAAKSQSRGRAFVWMIIFVGLSALTVQGIVAVRLRIPKKSEFLPFWA